MWKKDSPDAPQPTASPAAARTNPTPPPSPASAPAPPERPAPSPSASRGRAVIGASIEIQGDVRGGEDLLIEGRIEGKVELAEHSVTVGGGGRVNGEVEAKVITLEGAIQGNLNGHQQVVIRSSGRMRGDVKTPRLVIEDGARFKGTIDMDVDMGERSEPRADRSRLPARPAETPLDSALRAVPTEGKVQGG